MFNYVYFKNLNGFRFIAALMVIVCHLELFKQRIGQPNIWRLPVIFEGGSAGVDFFFVLSGFLITYLLLAENKKKETISLRKFYVRRILRIWPLYFLIVAITFCIVPYINSLIIPGYSEQLEIFPLQKFFLCLILMPNVALSFFGEMPYAGPLWSIGVEEQFYIFWPILLLLFRQTKKTIIGFTLAFILLKVLALALGFSHMISSENYERIKNFIVGLRMECMGIGAIGAYFAFHNSPILKKISKNSMAKVSIILVPILFYVVPFLFEVHHILLSLLFLVIILNGATNPNTFINLEHSVLRRLGTISYGLYLWHPICIGIALYIMNTLNLWASEQSNLFYYGIALSLIVSISLLSYFYFEKLFLKLKRKYTIISSGNVARFHNIRIDQ
ncbi:MAG: acyltransferase [Flavitalea sp.]